MLTSYLNTRPFPKFVLIQDTITDKGAGILESLLTNHEKNPDYKTQYFIFERNFNAVKYKRSNSTCHDFTSDVRNWLKEDTRGDLKTVLKSLNENSIVVVDSLVHVLYRYGLQETYQIFNEIKGRTDVLQIITVLHTDLLTEKDQTIKCFHHLATLHMELDNHRVSYTFKKSPRKVIKQIEQYRLENGKFLCETIKKPDQEIVEKVIEQSIPENITTFKISLNEKEKELRDNLLLPYLPKDEGNDPKIHYAFDEIDDWDEEDPDDDLDI